jgi:hypothetical protein
MESIPRNEQEVMEDTLKPFERQGTPISMKRGYERDCTSRRVGKLCKVLYRLISTYADVHGHGLSDATVQFLHPPTVMHKDTSSRPAT